VVPNGGRLFPNFPALGASSVFWARKSGCAGGGGVGDKSQNRQPLHPSSDRGRQRGRLAGPERGYGLPSSGCRERNRTLVPGRGVRFSTPASEGTTQPPGAGTGRTGGSGGAALFQHPHDPVTTMNFFRGGTCTSAAARCDLVERTPPGIFGGDRRADELYMKGCRERRKNVGRRNCQRGGAGKGEGKSLGFFGAERV